VPVHRIGARTWPLKTYKPDKQLNRSVTQDIEVRSMSSIIIPATTNTSDALQTFQEATLQTAHANPLKHCMPPTLPTCCFCAFVDARKGWLNLFVRRDLEEVLGAQVFVDKILEHVPTSDQDQVKWVSVDPLLDLPWIVVRFVLDPLLDLFWIHC